MKKSIIVLVAIIAVAALALTYVFVINDPERQIIGTWTKESGNLSFEFSEDGKVSIPIEFFGLGLEADIKGAYEIDKKADEIIFTFSAFSLEYSRTYGFKIDGKTLTLTNQSNDNSTAFIKQEAN